MDAEVKKCPICLGRGLVQEGFYRSFTTNYTSSGVGQESCRSCNGKGYIIVTKEN